jgi:hypothetical protein
MPTNLHVSTGPTLKTLTPTAPNSTTITPLTPHLDVTIQIQNFTGTPHASTPLAPDLPTPNGFGITYIFTPDQDIPGDELLIANTFDGSIKHLLPWFWRVAWKALRWLDPGVRGDLVHETSPWIAGTVLGSCTFIDASGNEHDPESSTVQESMPTPIPQTSQSRKAHFATSIVAQKHWTWKRGQKYRFMFGTGVVEFSGDASGKGGCGVVFRLPGMGFGIDVEKWWDINTLPPVRWVLTRRREVGGEVEETIYGAVQMHFKVIDPKEDDI